MDGKTTLTEQLAQVNAAITAVLAGGQSYRLGNQSVTRADLAALKALRDDLAAQAAQEDADELLSRTYAARFDGR